MTLSSGYSPEPGWHHDIDPVTRIWSFRVVDSDGITEFTVPSKEVWGCMGRDAFVTLLKSRHAEAKKGASI